MESAKPPVEREWPVAAVIAFEIFVMKVMEKVARADGDTIGQHHTIKSRMALCGRDARVLNMPQGMNGVGWYNPVEDDSGKINQVLNRVHGNASQGAVADVIVMQIVGLGIKDTQMADAVRPIEMKVTEQRHNGKHQAAIDWVIAE